jgi:two-component system, sensor histidine kinase
MLILLTMGRRQWSNPKYDVIFMDMQMPVMCGLEATKLIVAQRGVDKEEKPHVVFVTAHATHDFQLLAKSAGGSGFISKPFNLKAIQNVFESLDGVQSNETSVVEC